MNTFKTQKIRSAPPRKPLSEKTKHNIAAAAVLILTVFFLYTGSVWAVQKLSRTRLLQWISGFVGKELAADERRHTNILLLGVGGEGHEGKDLTDTIIVASIDQTDGWVSMLSIPRDLYVESDLGGVRINRLYEKGKLQWESEQGLDFTRAAIEKILAIPIHYSAKIDFDAFEQIVDAVGGIDVYVEQNINDPEYPRDGTYEFDPFYLEKGPQHLDGKTALKYVRSRHSSSDFDRSRRQHEALLALKEKAEKENLLGSKSKVRDIYNSLQQHVETDFSLRELLTLASVAADWKPQRFTSATLSDEPIFQGGFLYTPLRELFGGAYVLLPAGDSYDSLRHFVQLVFYGPRGMENYPVVVLNGTATSGLAARVRAILNRFGVTVVAAKNAREANLAATTWYSLAPEAQPAVEFLQRLIPGSVQVAAPDAYRLDPKFASLLDGQTKIILELGADSLGPIASLDIFKNVVPLKPADSGTTTPPAASTTSGI